jgi:hypothetical protein
MKKLGILVIALSFLVVGMAMAAYLPPETPETSVISSVGTVKCVGTTFVNTDAVLGVGASSGGCGKGGDDVTSFGVYTNDLLAKGNTDYASSIEIDSSNKLDNQDNIETAQLLNYAGPGAIYSEDMFMMGSGGGAESNTLCPFGTDAPAFCSKVEANVNFMGKALDYQSAGGIRTVAKTQDTPAEFSFAESAVGNGVLDVKYSVTDLDARKLTYHKPHVAASSEFDQRYRTVGSFDVNTAFSYASGLTL